MNTKTKTSSATVANTMNALKTFSLAEICNPGLRDIYNNPLFGISSRLPFRAMATQCFLGCMTRKRTPALTCAGINPVLYQMCNHPENDGGAAVNRSTAAQSSGACGEFERKEPNLKCQQAGGLSQAKTIVLVILFYLLMKDLWPTGQPILLLLIAMLQSLLQGVFELWLGFLPKVFSWRGRGTDEEN